MKMKQTLATGAVLLSAFSGLTASNVYADTAATVGLSNMYYWRGFDLGGGAAVIADVSVSVDGFTGGLWTSSGDGTLGTEYDIYAGYSGKAGDFTYGLSVVSYNYANPKTTTGAAIDPSDYTEVIPSVGYGPFKLTYYKSVSAKTAPLDNNGYSYATAELNFTKFAFKLGTHMSDDGAGLDGVTFLDSTYKYNEKLSFTIGKVLDQGNYDSVKKIYAAPKEAHFVVNLTLPII